MAFLIVTLGLLLSSNLISAGSVSYDASKASSVWTNDDHDTCVGKFQSPIDIEENNVAPASYPDLEFSGLQKPHKALIMNNGHTVMIQSIDSESPEISGASLNSTYVFEQLHFHWGNNDSLGSEDLINNHSYSMEMHAVFWKKAYGTYDEAIKHDDGLSVLGYWYQATNEPNPVFASVVSQILEIRKAGSNEALRNSDILSKLIAPDLASAQDYFTYKGSLTTPPCLEIVQWIDFAKPQHISHEQLAAFRSIQSFDGDDITHNFRPVQPLDGRTVYRNVRDEQTTAAPALAKIPEIASSPAPKKLNTNTLEGAPVDNKKDNGYSGANMWTVSPFAVILAATLVLPYQ
ncbi:carbonic anhydrase 2-like [Bombus bifarius]|uniref:Carbonic anhydrase 2-like n=1 Tax=Bombus bifarius TaxID=103933 RepID=A0A6P8MBW5_9HYME|nr:carbonic anhydrase 2-like [Bombus bifarius]